MKNDYTTEEINDILLSKKLNDYYLAIISRKPLGFTESEYTEKILNNPFVSNEDKDDLEEIFSIDSKYSSNNESLREQLEELKYMLVGLCVRENRWGIITIIDGRIYDTAAKEFIDSENYLIGRYDNITNFYDESNARPKLFHPGDEDLEITCDTVLMDLDDLSILQKYGEEYGELDYSEDLSPKFIEEYNASKNILQRKHSIN